jgi:protein involved in polysaccharide export with SLBB domain
MASKNHWRKSGLIGFIALGFLSTGCAAITNPVADGIPVRRLPAEVLGRPKSDLKPIPLTVLRQPEAKSYLLDKGDVLAVVAEDILAPANQLPPIRMPDLTNRTAAIGFPVPVSDDGTISLPRLKPIDVRGKSLKEVEVLIRESASGKYGNPELIKPGVGDAVRISVQLLERRTYSITVVREDTVPFQPLQQGIGAGPVFGVNKKGASYTIRLPAGENDVLRAMNAAGGPPGLDAKNEILVFRGQYDPSDPTKAVTRIPLRIYPEQQLDIPESSIILKDGDVVMIEARDTDLYYISGIAGSRQFPLPRDYDLDVLQALSVSGAPLANGGFSQNAFVASAVSSGLGSPSPALCVVLRQLPNGQQIPIRVD